MYLVEEKVFILKFIKYIQLKQELFVVFDFKIKCMLYFVLFSYIFVLKGCGLGLYVF